MENKKIKNLLENKTNKLSNFKNWVELKIGLK